MTLPTFLIIGAAKAGTTSLHDYLRQHPDVFVPEQKELRFFAFEGVEPDPRDPVHRRVVRDFAHYQELFAETGTALAVGEASPAYLTSPAAARRIRDRLPEARLIASLRDPADRAWSHFLFAKQKGLEPPEATFEDVFLRDRIEVNGFVRSRPYLDCGFYARGLKPYFELFPRDRIKIVMFDDLRKDPVGVANEVYQFVGVGAFAPRTTVTRAASGVPRSSALQRTLGADAGWKRVVRRWLPRSVRSTVRHTIAARNLKKPPLDPALRTRLVDLYRRDVEELEDLLDRSFAPWRTA